MDAGWFYFSFVVLFLIHMQEEYWSGFPQKFPPPRFVGNFTGKGFWVLNPSLLSIATAVGVAAGAQAARIIENAASTDNMLTSSFLFMSSFLLHIGIGCK